MARTRQQKKKNGRKQNQEKFSDKIVIVFQLYYVQSKNFLSETLTSFFSEMIPSHWRDIFNQSKCLPILH